MPDPKPITLEDLSDLMLGRGDHTFARGLIFAALSNKIEPLEPMPSLLPSTPLATPWGYKPASQLKRGDTVMTQGSGVVPVLQRVSRTVPVRGSYAPVRLCARYFELQQDIITCL